MREIHIVMRYGKPVAACECREDAEQVAQSIFGDDDTGGWEHVVSVPHLDWCGGGGVCVKA